MFCNGRVDFDHSKLYFCVVPMRATTFPPFLHSNPFSYLIYSPIILLYLSYIVLNIRLYLPKPSKPPQTVGL